MQRRDRWHTIQPNLTPGVLVILQDELTPPTEWPLGRIEAVHMGKDGLVRTVSVRTARGIYKRPIQKLCVLPAASSHEAPVETPLNQEAALDSGAPSPAAGASSEGC